MYYHTLVIVQELSKSHQNREQDMSLYLPASSKPHHIERIVSLLDALQVSQLIAINPFEWCAVDRVIAIQRSISNILPFRHRNGCKLCCTLDDGLVHNVVRGRLPSEIDVERKKATLTRRGIRGAIVRSVREDL